MALLSPSKPHDILVLCEVAGDGESSGEESLWRLHTSSAANLPSFFLSLLSFRFLKITEPPPPRADALQ